MKRGKKGKVLRISKRCDDKRIIERGLAPGAIVEVERMAGRFGDGTVEVKVRGYHISMRKDEAEGIEIEKIF